MNDTDKTKEDTGVHEEPRVMSRDDVHDYEGLTLNEDGKEEKKEEEARKLEKEEISDDLENESDISDETAEISTSEENAEIEER